MAKPKFEREQQVTLPMSNMQDGETKYYRIESEMVEGTPVLKADGTPGDKQATTARATDLETGEQVQLIMQSVMESSLKRFGNYVGSCFEMTCKGKRQGKRYKDFDIFKIKDPVTGE